MQCLRDVGGHRVELEAAREPAQALRERSAGGLVGVDVVEPSVDAARVADAHLLGQRAQGGERGERGIHRWLDHIDATEPACAVFTQRLRGLASRFQLDAMAADIAQALRSREVSHG